MSWADRLLLYSWRDWRRTSMATDLFDRTRIERTLAHMERQKQEHQSEPVRE